MEDTSVALDKVIALYRDMVKKSIAWGLEPRFDIRGSPSVINEIFGDAQTFTVDGRTVKIVRDAEITPREVGADFQSDIYIYDPEQLKKNEEESRIYGLDMLIDTSPETS